MERNAFSALACAALVFGICSCATRTPPAGGVSTETAATGFLLAKDIAFAADFTKDDRPVHIDASPGKPVKVPAGIYYLNACIIEKTDAGGEKWRMTGFGRNIVAATIEPGQTSEIAFGPPIKAELVASRQGSEFSFGIAISGEAGECYSPVVKHGSAETRPPGIEIRNAAGDLIDSGRFRYG